MATQTIEELLEDLKDRDKIIGKLEDECADKDTEIDSLRSENTRLEGELEDAENQTYDTEDLSDSQIDAEFRQRNGIDATLVNDIKIELFFENFDKFTPEQFESFLKGLTS